MTFLEKATALMPEMLEERIYPVPESEPGDRWMRTGAHFTLDFGTHAVGYFTLQVETDQTPDSPLEIDFHFAEMPFELSDAPYNGGLSSTWFQRDRIHLDHIPAEIRLPRRYAFRYVRITFPGNTAYRVRYTKCFVTAVSSADMGKVPPLPAALRFSPQMRVLDAVSLRTLRNCMLTVFEDGPKRDRRLWLGDLYLQAKANHLTFRNEALVRRCLYLFAGLPHPDGCLSSAVYPEPVLRNQSWILHDYALFFIGVLHDLYEATGDRALLEELWPVALRQTEIACDGAALDEKGLVSPPYYFIDWCQPLDKTAAAQGLAITMLRKALELAGVLEREADMRAIAGRLQRLTEAAKGLYDRELGLFVSGPARQVSVISQAWMVLADMVSQEEGAALLERLARYPQTVRTVTPFAMHFYVEALLHCGCHAAARAILENYWGAMVEKGADCFWEVYVPEDPEASPYGDKRINSYCHAWSCTPTYFIRRYPEAFAD